MKYMRENPSTVIENIIFKDNTDISEYCSLY